MRILLATSAAIPNGGGIASYNLELTRELGSDYSIDLLTDADEVNVVGYGQTFSLYGKKKYSYKFSKSLVSFINANNYHLIINSRSSVIPYIAPFLNAPIVSVAHFVDGIQADNAAYNSKYISKIIALSYFCRDYLANKFHILDISRIEVVYNFVAQTTKQWSDDKLKSNVMTIVYPGGTSIQKSADVVADMLKLLLATNLQFHFIWIGNTLLPSANFSLWGFKRIDQLYNKDSRVSFVGMVSRSDSINYIESANIFLLPSRGEGCPMTLLEAMRKGCIPVISDSKHGSLELITECSSGVVVRQGSSVELYNVIKDILENSHKYQDSYKATYDFAYCKLSQQKWGKQMREIIATGIASEKKQIKMTLFNWGCSLVPWRNLLLRHRLKSIIYSITNRIIMDILYFKWRILKSLKAYFSIGNNK